MLIEQAFKQFTDSVLKQTKNKKDYDLCIDTYAKTQLIDLSALDTLDEVFDKVGSFKPESIIFDEQPDYIKSFTLPEDLEITLPFDECFIKIAENNANVKEVYVFTRELSPMLYTGTALIHISSGVVLKIPFHISYNIPRERLLVSFDLEIISKVDKDQYNSCIKLLIVTILRTFITLSLLNNKSHTIYKVNADRPEYLRKKLTKNAIKVQRPIYIYLNKSTEIIRSYPKYANRKIERLSSWIVRGHWRRLDNPKKRGKDAQGKYVVEGFTWVVPHVCGDKDKINNKTYIAIGK